MDDGEKPRPGGWNRVHSINDDLAADIERLRGAGVQFRNDVVTGPVARRSSPSTRWQPIELFQPGANGPNEHGPSRAAPRADASTRHAMSTRLSEGSG
jgi:hypothetical protein